MPANHNHAPAATTELSPEARALIDIDAVESWRSAQHGALDQMRADATDSKYIAEFEAEQDAMLNQFLEDQGLKDTDADYDSVRRLFERSSITNYTNSQWNTRPISRKRLDSDNRSGRDIISQDMSEIYRSRLAPALDSDLEDSNLEPDNPPTAEPDNQDNDKQRTPEQIRADLDAARGKWAEISATKQGRLGDRRIHGHNAARDEYNTLVQELGRQELKDVVDDDTLSADEKNAKVVKWLLEEQDKLREMTIDELHSTRVGKFVKWMNSGSFGMRLLKGAGVGVAAGATGAIVAGGAAGIALGGALAAGVVGASRFVRGYAVHDNRGMGRVSEVINDETRNDIAGYMANGAEDQRLERAAERLHGIFEEDTKYEQVKRRKAVAWGIGSVAAGAALGYGIHLGAQYLSGSDLSILNSGRDTPTAASVEVGANPDLSDESPTDTTQERRLPLPLDMRELDTQLPVNEQGPTPQLDSVVTDIDAPAEAAAAPADAPDQSGASERPAFAAELTIPEYTVSSGEGWYETFSNLGINDTHNAQLLDTVGPKLVDMGVATPHGDSYWIASAGELPHDATELIMTTAHDNGWLIATNPELESLPVVANGEGLNSFVNDHYDHTLTSEQSLELGELLHDNGYMYESTQLEQNYGNPYGINEPGRIDQGFDATVREYLEGTNGETAGATGLDAGVQPGGLEDVPATDIQPSSEFATTTDMTGVDVDDESLYPTGEQAAPDGSHDDVDLNADEQERFDDIAANEDMTDAERQAHIDHMTTIFEQRDFEALNTYDAPELKLDELAQTLHQSNAEYSDGSRIVSLDDYGNYKFNAPDASDATVKYGTLNIIDSHLGKVDAELRQDVRRLVLQS